MTLNTTLVNAAMDIEQAANLLDDDMDWLDYLTAEAREVVRSGGEFHIEDEDSADWYLKILGRYENELGCLHAQYLQRVERVTKAKASFEKRFGEEFNHYVLEAIKRPGFKGKTLHLSYGSAAVTSYKRKLKVANAAAARAFAKQSVPAAITIVPATEKLSVSSYTDAAQQALNDTGEIMPGIEIVPECDKVAVKLPGGEK